MSYVVGSFYENAFLDTRIAHRLDLIMKALRYKSLPPEVAPEVFDCWICCCTSLGPRLVLLFEDVKCLLSAIPSPSVL